MLDVTFFYVLVKKFLICRFQSQAESVYTQTGLAPIKDFEKKNLIQTSIQLLSMNNVTLPLMAYWQY